jgi:hypothetical protein
VAAFWAGICCRRFICVNAAVVAIAKMSRKNRGPRGGRWTASSAFVGLAVMSFVALMASLTLLAIF